MDVCVTGVGEGEKIEADLVVLCRGAEWTGLMSV